jgi:cytochrome c2
MKRAAIAAAMMVLSVAGAAAQEADVAAGEDVFRKCQACHAVGEGAANRGGPALNGIMGKPAGTVPDFRYSPAMVTAGEGGLIWTHETLSEFLVAPRTYVKGTKMAFAGVKDDTERANLIAYLATFSPEYEEPAE